MSYRRFRRTAYFPPDAFAAGVSIDYDTRRRTLRIGGWFDSIAGIESTDVGLAEFLQMLDITDADIAAARKDISDDVPTA